MKRLAVTLGILAVVLTLAIGCASEPDTDQRDFDNIMDALSRIESRLSEIQGAQHDLEVELAEFQAQWGDVVNMPGLFLGLMTMMSELEAIGIDVDLDESAMTEDSDSSE